MAKTSKREQIKNDFINAFNETLLQKIENKKQKLKKMLKEIEEAKKNIGDNLDLSTFNKYISKIDFYDNSLVITFKEMEINHVTYGTTPINELSATSKERLCDLHFFNKNCILLSNECVLQIFNELSTTTYNLKKTTRIKAFPHQNTNGRSCFGGYNTLLMLAKEKSNIKQFIATLLQWARSCDLSDAWGAQTKYFYQIDKQTNKEYLSVWDSYYNDTANIYLEYENKQRNKATNIYIKRKKDTLLLPLRVLNYVNNGNNKELIIQLITNNETFFCNLETTTQEEINAYNFILNEGEM